MHVTLERAVGLTLSLSICIAIGVPLINLVLNTIGQAENYQNASVLMSQIDYAAKEVLERGGVYLDRVNIPPNISVWSLDKTVYCQYGDGDNYILKQTYPLIVNLTPPNGSGEFLLSVSCDDGILVIRFLEV
ncbi:MAG: hypothetical protein QW327_00780 [Candidatus Odinarchaeota archaeon]